MSESVVSYALTTKVRVKARIGISVTSGFDLLLDRLISAATDFIEGECNRRFKETVYSNEVYSIYGEQATFVLLKQSPVTALTAFQYRAGTISVPAWTSFNADDYELLEDGKSGIIKVYGLIRGVNAVRASYTAGYKISFNDAGDATKHTLPADLSDLCERLVIRWFKRRESEGKASESFESSNVNWKDSLNEEDKAILERYMKLPVFV